MTSVLYVPDVLTGLLVYLRIAGIERFSIAKERFDKPFVETANELMDDWHRAGVELKFLRLKLHAVHGDCHFVRSALLQAASVRRIVLPPRESTAVIMLTVGDAQAMVSSLIGPADLHKRFHLRFTRRQAAL